MHATLIGHDFHDCESTLLENALTHVLAAFLAYLFLIGRFLKSSSKIVNNS